MRRLARDFWRELWEPGSISRFMLYVFGAMAIFSAIILWPLWGWASLLVSLAVLLIWTFCTLHDVMLTRKGRNYGRRSY